jgi:demethylmenaquinone methyltransferase/2-methoxy-6-polyprenyl-1,4-benzoquinol methylase
MGADGLPPHAPLGEYYRDERERRRFLNGLFDETAHYYERINALASFGTGAWYRRFALRRAGLTAAMRVLDAGLGTGALARAALGVAGPSTRVVGLDPSRGMLAEARRTLPVPVVQGLAEWLPFRDASFDFVSMGYALRHVADLHQVFVEYHRVLRPGGRLVVLEFVRPRTRLGYGLARLYLGRIVPCVTSLDARSAEVRRLMRYCWDTVDHGVPPDAIAAALGGCGLSLARHTVWFGVLSEHVAVKPLADPRPAAA